MKATAETSLQTASVQFTDCKITDNSGDSHFHCQQFVATIFARVSPPTPPATLSPSSWNQSFQASVHILTPFIVLYQHDLSWWVNYARGPHLSKLFGRKSTFEDDFSQNALNAEENSNVAEIGGVVELPRIFIESELTDFQCQLRHSDGSAVVFGIDLATLAADHALEEVEFGVESLWCHHAEGGVLNERVTLDPTKHAWGTTVAIGAGLAKVGFLK